MQRIFRSLHQRCTRSRNACLWVQPTLLTSQEPSTFSSSFLHRSFAAAKKKKSKATTSDSSETTEEAEDAHMQKTVVEMDKTMKWLRNEFSKLRPGKANAGMFDHVQVEAYGGFVPLNECGQVGLQGERMLTINVFDPSLASAVKKALVEKGGLDLNPQVEGASVKVPIPRSTKESRDKLVKVAKAHSEKAKQRLLRARRDGMDIVKRRKKNKEMSEDILKLQEKEVQEATDSYSKEVVKLLQEKENDIMK